MAPAPLSLRELVDTEIIAVAGRSSDQTRYPYHCKRGEHTSTVHRSSITAQNSNEQSKTLSNGEIRTVQY